VGVEQAGVRPALVLSNDWFNAAENYLFVVVPITGTDRKIRYQVKMQGKEGGLTKHSVIMCEQIRSMDIRRFLRKRGTVSARTLAQVKSIVTMIVGESASAWQNESTSSVDAEGIP
jgi:mRNA interferase MazF